MATPASVSTESRVESLRAFMVNLARSNCLLLPETELFEQKFIELCLSPTPDHPTYAAMIFTAITELDEEGGSNKEAISEFIKSKYKGLPFAHTSLLIHHLAKLVEKREIVRDCNNCYLFPRETTSASSDDEEKQVKKKLRSPDSGNRRNCQCSIEGKDLVDEDMTAEAITRLNGEENDRILQYEEHEVENGGSLLGEQGLMTGAKACPEGKANGRTLQSEKLEAAVRDQSLEVQDLTTEAEVFSEIDESTAILRSEQLEDQDMRNCESLNDEKQKQKLGDVQCLGEDMHVQFLGEVHGDSGNFVRGPNDQTQDESAMINREDNETLVFQGEVESFDEARQTENKEGKVSLEHGKAETPKIDWVVIEHVTLEDSNTEGRIEVNKEEEKSQKKQDVEDETHRINELNGPDEQEDEMREEVSHGEEKQIGISANLWKVEFPGLVEMGKAACAEVILERDEMRAETQVICEEEQSQEKPERKEQTHKIVVAEVVEEQEDKTELELNCGDELETEKAGDKDQLKDQHLTAPRARVQTLQDIPYEAMCEPDAQPSKVREALRRLWEQQIEACHDIVALKKMLKQCTKNQELNETVSAMGGSFGVQNDVAPCISLPLSKESCTQLWKLVHKIQGQLFEIISSYDNAEVPYESSGREAESIGKGPAKEGYEKAKCPCKRKESRAFCPSKQLEHKKRDSASQRKPLMGKTCPKRPRVGKSFGKHKQAKFCDWYHTSILVRGDEPFDSSISKKAETVRESAQAITTPLEKEYQPEKPNLTATAVLALPVPEPETIEKPQPKAKRPDQVALQIEVTNRTIMEPLASPSKQIVEDGRNQFGWKKASAQPEGNPNLDAPMMDTHFSDHPNSNEKQLQKQDWEKSNALGPGMSSDEQIFEPEPQLSGQLISQALAENECMGVDYPDPSQPGLVIKKPEAKPPPKRYKRRGQAAKRKGNAEVSENTQLHNADENNHQKQEPLMTQKLGPQPDAPSTTEPRPQTLTRLGLPHAVAPGRITRARAAAAAAAVDA